MIQRFHINRFFRPLLFLFLRIWEDPKSIDQQEQKKMFHYTTPLNFQNVLMHDGNATRNVQEYVDIRLQRIESAFRHDDPAHRALFLRSVSDLEQHFLLFPIFLQSNIGQQLKQQLVARKKTNLTYSIIKHDSSWTEAIIEEFARVTHQWRNAEYQYWRYGIPAAMIVEWGARFLRGGVIGDFTHTLPFLIRVYNVSQAPYIVLKKLIDRLKDRQTMKMTALQVHLEDEDVLTEAEDCIRLFL